MGEVRVTENQTIPGRRYLYPNLLIVLFVLVDVLLFFHASLTDFTAILIIEGLFLDFAGAIMFATLDSGQLYGSFRRGDIVEEERKRDTGITTLERNLTLGPSDDGFEALKRAVERGQQGEISVKWFDIDPPDSDDWNEVENEENPVQAYPPHDLMPAHKPMVKVRKADGESDILGTTSHLKTTLAAPAYSMATERKNSYLRSAMVLFAVGFLLQIMAYFTKLFFVGVSGG